MFLTVVIDLLSGVGQRRMDSPFESWFLAKWQISGKLHCKGCRWDRKGPPSTFINKPGIHRRPRRANRGFGTRFTFSP
ncbi:hypothetical protein SRHO_G00028380 [Serrasalmus rhombeus]